MTARFLPVPAIAPVSMSLIFSSFCTSMTETVPSNIIAGWFRFGARDFFQKTSDDAANVPLVPGIPPPPQLLKLSKRKVIGLRVNVSRLLNIREHRVAAMNMGPLDDYLDKREVARAVDRTHIQIRLLNQSKGPAVQALRVQADKRRYSLHMKHTLETTPNLYLKQARVEGLLVQGDRVQVRRGAGWGAVDADVVGA